MELKWQKSSYSGAGGENCVEIAERGDTIMIRESDAPNVRTSTSRSNFAVLIKGVQAGRFDHFAT
ncbi:DUF397 domain-containing protein [Streptomyces varsoviensis]|uniref:DUF397 domain-containing protein n=1 Tax=Streptomyces varsoviensis TaxID=67373 RepID=A0ABR5J542_9ACTN|nr:DUF397 domain-containing protein [Streptomyces varsoviensis]KOG88591.1 hypothetical protein ADK38_18960 [Streptomyces varsoviensis]